MFVAAVEIEEESDIATTAAKTAAVFVWESWTRSKHEHREQGLNLWVDGEKKQQNKTKEKRELRGLAAGALSELFGANAEASAWLAAQLLGRRQRWLRHFLLDCEEGCARAAFVRWLSLVARALLEAESPAGLLLRTVRGPKRWALSSRLTLLADSSLGRGSYRSGPDCVCSRTDRTAGKTLRRGHVHVRII